jgi:hypothetical protein
VAGRYQDSTNQTSCIACNAGSRTNTGKGTGASSCTACAAGQYTSTSTVACRACAAGQYLSGPGATTCISCAAGRYTDSPGKSSCAQCAVGQFSEISGADQCDPCAAAQSRGSSLCIAISAEGVDWRRPASAAASVASLASNQTQSQRQSLLSSMKGSLIAQVDSLDASALTASLSSVVTVTASPQLLTANATDDGLELVTKLVTQQV